MDARIRALEEQMPVINGKLDLILDRLEALKQNSAAKADVALLRAEMATRDELGEIRAGVVVLASKDDLNGVTRASAKDIQDVATGLHKTLNDQTWKFVTLAAGLAGIAFTAAKLIH
ncbi:hypothetical protein [Pseudomonas oryzihabitans]|uniref:hypothetical protein n=1 Tax=Pseudomonas oryzihabitans TaxID=47885 RepID=UPI0011A832F7|nr:hypothetical protein [Pseudomonas oryzihabitans]